MANSTMIDDYPSLSKSAYSILMTGIVTQSYEKNNELGRLYIGIISERKEVWKEEGNKKIIG